MASGLTSCSNCIPGRYSNAVALSVCALCDKGTYSNAGYSICVACTRGKYTDTGMSRSKSKFKSKIDVKG